MFGSSILSGVGVILTVGLLIAITWIVKKNFSQTNKSIKYGKNVPGSMGWPIIGHMPYLNPSNSYPNIEYYTKKYGPIFRIKLGSYEGVMINDYNLIKKAFSSQDFASRPKNFISNLNSMEGHGLISSTDEIWQVQRPFVVSQLRRLGMGKSSLEATVHAEINEIFSEWKKTIGSPMDVNVSLNISTTNIIWSIISGQRMAYDDPKFTKLVVEVSKRIELGSTVNPIVLFPWTLRVLPKRFLNLDYLIEITKSFNNFAQELIDSHKKTIDYKDPKDFVDHFIVMQKKEENNLETTFTNTQLLVTLSDLFLAGAETTATTLRWAILLISGDLTVQRRMQDEIDQIIGYDRHPKFADCAKMPYTTAVINEVMRFADIVPFSVPHASSKDSTFEGYHIPKDRIIFGLLGGTHRNPKYWAKPNEFYPEHFLDAEGKRRQKVEGYFPFSTGKRSCPGEQLARIELFNFITRFFQHFNMRLADSPTPNLEGDPKSGLIRWPNPYKIILEERHHC